jgi:hypothetical protein
VVGGQVFCFVGSGEGRVTRFNNVRIRGKPGRDLAAVQVFGFVGGGEGGRAGEDVTLLRRAMAARSQRLVQQVHRAVWPLLRYEVCIQNQVIWCAPLAAIDNGVFCRCVSRDAAPEGNGRQVTEARPAGTEGRLTVAVLVYSTRSPGVHG